VSYHYGFLVETMVSILLLLTILYCVRLNKQLRLLKADENSLRATISELVTATEIADRAIAGLKSMMQQGEQTLSQKLERGEALAAELDLHLSTGNQLLARLVRIAGVTRPVGESPTVQDAKAVAAAAQAFADRARTRLSDQAA
jgi:Domain of unknown function (DUF6468)